MLSALRTQVHGRAAERVAARATASADRLIRKLLGDSISHWIAEDFERYNDYEISFTARLYYWCLEVQQANRGEMISMHIQYDGPLPTRRMLLGLDDPARSPRPDLVVRCGEALILVEAKRLSSTGDLPKDYVHKGMMRFIGRRYISPTNTAHMLGYVIADPPPDCYETVNQVILSDPRLGPDHVAKERGKLADKLDLYESDHDFGRILHYAIDLRGRKAPNISGAPAGGPLKDSNVVLGDMKHQVS